MKMDELWTEKDLCGRLDVPIGKTGKSRSISRWIANGLSYVDLDGRRYFVEQDVLDYLLKHYQSRLKSE